jgi:hypothetical protein
MCALQGTFEQVQVDALGFQLSGFVAEAEVYEENGAFEGEYHVAGGEVTMYYAVSMEFGDFSADFAAKLCPVLGAKRVQQCLDLVSFDVLHDYGGVFYVYHENRRGRHACPFCLMHQLWFMNRPVTPDSLVKLGRAVSFRKALLNDDAFAVPVGEVEAGFCAFLE